MIAYLDTSLMVAAITAETTTAAAQKWLADQGDLSMLISDWVVTEVSAALATKVRTGAITGDQRAEALAMFRQLTRDRLSSVAVPDVAFLVAARFADDAIGALKAGDALHLAIAAHYGATVCTFDHRQAAAGPTVGVPTLLIA